MNPSTPSIYVRRASRNPWIEPNNAWTSLAYSVFGGVMLMYGVKDVLYPDNSNVLSKVSERAGWLAGWLLVGTRRFRISTTAQTYTTLSTINLSACLSAAPAVLADVRPVVCGAGHHLLPLPRVTQVKSS